MSTARLQARDALVERLEACSGLTVHRNLDYALEDRNLPTLAVQSGNDEALPEASSFAIESGSARFGIAILVQSGADPEAAADVIEEALRADLKAHPTLTGKAVSLRYQGGEWDFELGDLALRRLIYEVTFAS
jgi:hypothetical protein